MYSLPTKSRLLFFIHQWNPCIPLWLTVYVKGPTHTLFGFHIHYHPFLTNYSTHFHIYLHNSRSSFIVTAPLQLLPKQCYFSCLGHTIPPKNHHWSYHCCPHWPSQDNIVMHVNVPSTLRTPAGNMAYLFSHPISANRCTSTTLIMAKLPKFFHKTPQSTPIPTDTPGNLNNRKNSLNNHSQISPPHCYGTPHVPLIPLIYPLKYPPPLTKTTTSRSFFLNCNNWVS